jgi:hypothetical protein
LALYEEIAASTIEGRPHRDWRQNAKLLYGATKLGVSLPGALPAQPIFGSHALDRNQPDVGL